MPEMYRLTPVDSYYYYFYYYYNYKASVDRLLPTGR